jgi:peptide/nickel transport system permease protein
VSAYIIRRLLYALPILIGVNALTFVLFFVVNSPDDMARMHLGDKRVTDEAILAWKQEHGYEKPLLLNRAEQGAGMFTETILFEKSIRLFVFDFGLSDSGRDISTTSPAHVAESRDRGADAGRRARSEYHLCATARFFRATYLDFWGVVLCVAMMSISSLFYIIGGQFLVGKLLNLVPISGYDTGVAAWKFMILPVIVGVIGVSAPAPAGIARCFWKRSTATTCVRPGPRVCLSNGCCSAMCCATR